MVKGIKLGNDSNCNVFLDVKALAKISLQKF